MDEPIDAAPLKRRRITRTGWIALFSSIGLVLAATLTTAIVIRGGGGGHDRAEDSPIVQAPMTVQPATTTTTTHKPSPRKVKVAKLPQPEAPPADPYAATPIVQIGAIVIPKIGLAHPIYEGITLTVIDHGPGHWPGSAMPGRLGNTVFPGHRVTHSHPFLNLDLLAPGDQIVFQMPGEDYVYKVTSTQIVSPTDVWVTNPTPTATVTLIACHPKHSAAQRIVVKGTLVASIPRPK
jgi:sortase A